LSARIEAVGRRCTHLADAFHRFTNRGLRSSTFLDRHGLESGADLQPGAFQEIVDLENLAAQADQEHAGEVWMLGVSGDGALQGLHALAGSGHPAPGAVAQGDDTVDIRVLRQSIPPKGVRNMFGRRCRAGHGGENADEVACGDASILSDDPLEGQAILFVAPRERRMLRAIEGATRQPIAPMQMPSHADIADRRINRFKQMITDTIEAQELGFFEELIGSYQQEQDIGLGEIAAALAYQLQRERPLVPEQRAAPKHREVAAETEPAAPGPRRRPKAQQDEGMVSYRIEVGREHGVQPKNIVGAIANEAGLESQYIGQIKLFDSYSLVDLPEGMPKEVFRHLQTVWVCGRQLRMSLAGGPPQPERSRKPRPANAAAKPKRKKNPA